MKYLYSGIFLSIIGALLSYALWGFNQAYLIPGGITALFIGLSMVTSGALVSGDTMRANFATETKEDRDTRNSLAVRCVLLGLPNLVVTLVLYFLI